MTFSCYEMQTPIEINEERISTLVIENSVFYRNFILDLKAQLGNCSSRFVLSEGNEILDVSKNVEFISDIFEINFDTRFFSSKLYQLALEECNISQKNQTEIIEKINELASYIVTGLPCEASYNPISDISCIIKQLGFYMDESGLSLPEKIIAYLSFLTNYSEKKVHIILNLKSALSSEEFMEFTKLVKYKKLFVLLIENRMFKDSCKYEYVRIIDKDLCEI